MTGVFTIRANRGAFTRAANQINRVVQAELQVGAPAGLELAGEAIIGAVQAKVSKPYPPASAPGEPSHLRSGELSDGYGYRITGAGERAVLGIGNDAEHFPFQEFGTSKMAARPALRPALREVRDKITESIARSMERAGRAAA